MPRIARIITEGFPHHIIQRGNRRQKVFFFEKDYQTYLNLLSIHSKLFNLEILCYCLMPNHVHLIVVPNKKENLSIAIGRTHQKYTRMINLRENWRGYLWQGRFSSYILDEPYLISAVRYILLNPVRANIVKRPQDYRYSSIRHHLKIAKIPFINDDLLQGLIGKWQGYLEEIPNQSDVNKFKLHERTGRPLGSSTFIEKLEDTLKKPLKKKKPGPKRKSSNN